MEQSRAGGLSDRIDFLRQRMAPQSLKRCISVAEKIVVGSVVSNLTNLSLVEFPLANKAEHMNALLDKSCCRTRVVRLKQAFDGSTRNPMEQGKLVWLKTLRSISNFAVVAEVTSVKEETTHVDQYHVKRIAYRWKLRRSAPR